MTRRFPYPFVPSIARQLDVTIPTVQSIIAVQGSSGLIAPAFGPLAERFRAFWDKRDPTPGTNRNERMEEYYFRVSAANEQYGSARDGWRTDRGHVLVLFGEPDLIEARSDGAGADPYEVWYYYGISRRFIFVGKQGGYQLLVPIWDERTRLR